MASITGTDGAERLVGTAEADVIDGLKDNDQLFGLGGDDTLNGGGGDDRLDGGAGADMMTGATGDDSYVVDDAGDVVVELAGEGRDTVTASVSYTLSATAEIERFVAATGTAAIDLTGNLFANQIFGNDGANVLSGGGGGDNLYGRGGDDTLTGSAADDLLDGGAGADAMAGGAGDDTYFVDSAGDTVTEAAGEGNDRVNAAVSFALALGAEVEQLAARGGAAIDLTGSDSANQITGNNAINALSGLGGDDRLNGRGGNDTLSGGDGADVLVGGAGADSMIGGAGDDTYYIDDAGDTVTETAGEGTDRAFVDATWTLGAGQSVESLILRGTAAIDVTGNDLANTIYGNKGGNTLDGGGGDDTLYGSGGDVLTGGTGADSYVISAAQGGEILVRGEAVDSLSSSDTGWLSAGISLLGGARATQFVQGSTSFFVTGGVDLTGLQTAPVFGTTTLVDGNERQLISRGTLDPDRGFVILGDSVGDSLGWTVSSAGDINGDGYDDLIVGARYGDDGGISAGEAYVVFGTADGIGTVDGSGRKVLDVTTLSPTTGFIIQGDEAGDQLGSAVSGAGDVNGDGYDDLIVGVRFGDDAGTNTGEAYIVFGGASGLGTDDGTGRAVIDLTTLSATQGFIVDGDLDGDFLGWAVSDAGDVNGDGFADVVIGARAGVFDGIPAGEAYVIFGTASGFGTADGAGRQVIDTTSLNPAQGFIIVGDQNGDQLGSSVSSAGDINGDGFDDVIIGAPRGDDAGDLAGEAYVIFGTSLGFGTGDGAGRQVIDTASLSAAQGFVIQGSRAQTLSGYSVSAAGDVNGDGYDDLIVGALYDRATVSYAGASYVVYGGAGGFGTDVGGRQVLDLATLPSSQGFVIGANAMYDRFGFSVSAAGDVNGDGIDDLIIGASFNDDGGTAAGSAYVVFGSTEGLGTESVGRSILNVRDLSPDLGFTIRGTNGDHLGESVSGAGDLNGDGFADLVVGAPLADGGGSNAGEALVIYGGPEGFDLAQVAGDDTDNNLTGSAAAERIVGGRGNDTLIGGGGADVFLAGSGDDVIDVGAGNLFRVYGGTGFDTLKIATSFDLGTLDGFVHDIESIDLTGNGSQTVTVTALDVLALGAADSDVLGTGYGNVLVITGDTEDRVALVDLGPVVSVASHGGVDYDLYAIGGNIALAVNQDIQILV